MRIVSLLPSSTEIVCQLGLRDALVGVMTDSGMFRNAVVKSSDAGGRLLEVQIPFDKPVRLLVTGFRLALVDAAGKTVPTGGAANVVSRASGALLAQPVTYTVSGILP